MNETIRTDYAGFDPNIAAIIERERLKGTRLRFHWGDTNTGHDWSEYYGTSGRIGRSTGHNPIPLLIYNSRSMGGGAIMKYIVRIRYANKKEGGDLYRHPTYYI